jgi:hypothetical protein
MLTYWTSISKGVFSPFVFGVRESLGNLQTSGGVSTQKFGK